MTRPFRPPLPESVAAVVAEAERPLSPEEFERRRAQPVSDEERAGDLELIAWFCRRYPTPRARLAYARRKYAEWARSMPPGAARPPKST